MSSLLAPVRRSATKHAAILAAATDLVAEMGYAAVTMEAIAARAGVGKQTLYRWWPGKPALFAEIYIGLAPDETLAANTGTLPGDLGHLLDAAFRLWRDTPAADILAGLIGEAQRDAATHATVASALVGGRAALLATPVRRAIARGELPRATDVDWVVRKLTAVLWHAILIDRASLGPALRDRLIADVMTGG
jgi:AcrR family transcriptional regulator